MRILLAAIALIVGAGGMNGQDAGPAKIEELIRAARADTRLCRYEGSVLMYIEIGTDGHVRREAVLQPMGLGLDEKAMDAASLWRFRPGMLDGKPVAVIAQIEINFRLLNGTPR